MSKYRELVDKATAKGFPDEAWNVLDEFIDMLCKKYPDMYDDIIEKLECLAYRIPKDEAEDIVRRMSPRGQYWSFNQAKEFVQDHGVVDNWVNWYLVLNMAYNDYYDTAKAFGLQNDPEFYYNIAKDFIEDPDAKPLKVEKYFLA